MTVIGFYYRERMPSGETRAVYHLWMKEEALPIVKTDNTEGILRQRIMHIVKDRHVKFTPTIGWDRKKPSEKRVYGRPSAHYDKIADMVKREFPALAPYLIVKKAKWIMRPEHWPFSNVPIKTWDPSVDAAMAYSTLIHMRKRFKWWTFGRKATK